MFDDFGFDLGDVGDWFGGDPNLDVATVLPDLGLADTDPLFLDSLTGDVLTQSQVDEILGSGMGGDFESEGTAGLPPGSDMGGDFASEGTAGLGGVAGSSSNWLSTLAKLGAQAVASGLKGILGGGTKGVGSAGGGGAGDFGGASAPFVGGGDAQIPNAGVASLPSLAGLSVPGVQVSGAEVPTTPLFRVPSLQTPLPSPSMASGFTPLSMMPSTGGGGQMAALDGRQAGLTAIQKLRMESRG